MKTPNRIALQKELHKVDFPDLKCIYTLRISIHSSNQKSFLLVADPGGSAEPHFLAIVCAQAPIRPAQPAKTRGWRPLALTYTRSA